MWLKMLKGYLMTQDYVKRVYTEEEKFESRVAIIFLSLMAMM
jgi:hypothetical protein